LREEPGQQLGRNGFNLNKALIFSNHSIKRNGFFFMKRYFSLTNGLNFYNKCFPLNGMNF
jgi:hypothetical protein